MADMHDNRGSRPRDGSEGDVREAQDRVNAGRRNRPDSDPGNGASELNTSMRDTAGRDREAKPKVKSELEVFIGKHEIHSPSSGVVSVDLKGLSPEAFILQAIKLSGRSDLVDPVTMKYLRKRSEFSSTDRADNVIKIDGYEEGSESLSFNERKRKELNKVSVSDAAVAHVAYKLLTSGKDSAGKDLFCGFTAEGRDGFLRDSKSGLMRYEFAPAGKLLHNIPVAGSMFHALFTNEVIQRRIAGMTYK